MAKADTDALVDDIEHVRRRLADDVDQLLDRSNPKNVAQRATAGVKAHFVADDGSPRLENILPIVAGTAGVITVLIALRRLTR